MVAVLEFIGIIGAFGAILFIINGRAGRALWHLIRTKTGQAGAYAEGMDPAGQMKQAAQDAASDLKGADDALKACDVMQEKLSRQIENERLTANRKRAQIKRKLDAGAADSDPEVISLARDVQRLEKSIEENVGQVQIQKEIYTKTLNSANSAAGKVKDAMARADRLKVKLDMGEQMVRLNGMLARYDPTAVDNKLANIDKFEEKALEQLDGHKATMRVMQDRGYAHDDEADTTDVSDVLASIRKDSNGVNH
jgi:hypothetical protein